MQGATTKERETAPGSGPAAPPSRGQRPLIGLFVIFLAALALQAAERNHRQRQATGSEPGRGAHWIWAPDATKTGQPVAFLAVRDFKLEQQRRAWVSLTVDESYVLWVNGVRVGSGIYREGRPAELYDVSRFVKLGWNRLMIEAASSRGAGGLLASIRLGRPNKADIVSDQSWRIFDRCEPWLLGGSRALGPGDGRSPQLWQRPPTGRWRPPSTLTVARSFELDVGARPLTPVRLRHPVASSPASWRRLDPGAPLPRLESQIVLDFGRPMVGHLEMGLASDTGPALLFFDLDDPAPVNGRPPDGVLTAVPGLREWHDPLARHFRYVTVVGAAPSGWARVRPASTAEAPVDLRRGVFGLEAAPPYRRVAESVWKRLTGKP